MKKSGFILVVCLLWQTPVFALGIEEILLTKLVDVIFSSDENNNVPTNVQSMEQDSPRVNSSQRPLGYQFHLSWQLPDDGTYSGVLEMRGKTGIFRVTTPKGDNIEQDMTAEPTNQGVVIAGSNPRHLENQLPAHYSPDIFILSKESGKWAITDACDDRGRCANVTILGEKEL